MGARRAMLIVVLLAGCQRSPPDAVSVKPAVEPDKGFFGDRTAGSGLSFTFRNGEEANLYTILEAMGGGVALLDYDRDGLLDVFVTGGGSFGPKGQILGHPNRLFRNLGDWNFRDVTAEVGLPTDGAFYSQGCAAADFDKDGWPDLLVTGYGKLALYRNDRGKFIDVTAGARLRNERAVHWSTSAAWADLNGDGWPDLFICHYLDWSMENNPLCPSQQVGYERDVCSPRKFKALPPELYFNNGDGTFTLSRQPGLLPGKGLGVIVADFDDDGRPDIYVANDEIENYLYINRGEGRFENTALAAGVALDDSGGPNGSMGVDAADYDGSGRLSLFVANYENEPNALYRNVGKGRFYFASRSAGVTAVGLSYVGFGTGFVDFDLDGAEDLFVNNGHAIRHPGTGQRAQKPVLLRNLRQPGMDPAQVRFEDVTRRGGEYFRAVHTGRGAAFGDLDNDGRVDIVLNPMNEPVTLLRNEVDNGHHWLGVALHGEKQRDIVGARLTLTQGQRKLVRFIKGGGSYMSSNDPRAVFGLGTDASAFQLEVRWPSGKTQVWPSYALGLDRYVGLTEGQDTIGGR